MLCIIVPMLHHHVKLIMSMLVHSMPELCLRSIHNVARLIILINITRISSPSKLSCLHAMHCYDLLLFMLHLMLVFAVGEMLRDKLIRCHRTELICAATFACMGRP